MEFNVKEMLDNFWAKAVDLVLIGGASTVAITKEVLHEDLFTLDDWKVNVAYAISILIAILRLRVLWYQGNKERDKSKK